MDQKLSTGKPPPEILIRVIGLVNGIERVKYLKPDIANNARLRRISGSSFVISDPNYEAKMEAFRNKKPFSENGVSKEPIKEAFAPKIEPIKTEPQIEQPKNEIATPAIVDEPKVKRTRRTKEQMKELKKQKV